MMMDQLIVCPCGNKYPAKQHEGGFCHSCGRVLGISQEDKDRAAAIQISQEIETTTLKEVEAPIGEDPFILNKIRDPPRINTIKDMLDANYPWLKDEPKIKPQPVPSIHAMFPKKPWKKGGFRVLTKPNTAGFAAENAQLPDTLRPVIEVIEEPYDGPTCIQCGAVSMGGLAYCSSECSFIHFQGLNQSDEAKKRMYDFLDQCSNCGTFINPAKKKCEVPGCQ